jgi:curved DNA-binding protein CbpA
MTPADGFLLSRVDGTLTAREVLDLAPMEREAAERSLLALITKGVVAWTERSARKAPARGTGPAPQPAGAQPTHAPPSADPAPPRQPDPAMDEERAERRREIENLHARLKTMNHFEALGVPRASSEKEVKAAYFSLARRFHPDTHSDPGLADLEDKIEAIFIRVGEAYEVLRNRDKRMSYESSLPRARPAPGGTPAPASTPESAAPFEAAPEPEAAPETDPLQLAARVSGAFRMAAKLYQDQKYFDAIRLLEGNLDVAQGPMRHRIRLLMAACKAKNPAWAKDAEEDILAVLKEDPKQVQAQLQLGLLYKEKNLKTRAASMFRKVLELDPDNEAARAELGPAVEEPSREAGGGLLKKLFRR